MSNQDYAPYRPLHKHPVIVVQRWKRVGAFALALYVGLGLTVLTAKTVDSFIQHQTGYSAQ